MKQKYTFTTTAMAAALEETPISYEDLAEIETAFDDADTEIVKTQAKLFAPLYAKRQKTVSQIPNFWPLVLEQAPPDIDQYIQPSDSALLLSSLTSLSVTRFEIESASPSSTNGANNPGGDPRSIAIRFEFSENEYFSDKVLEKRFWYRKAKDGWAGLVSEPVQIKWKKGKDLTGGLLDMVVKAWEVENKNPQEKEKGLSTEQKELLKKIEGTGMGGLSFFAWFGFIGRKVSAEESREAIARDAERRNARNAAKDGKDLTIDSELEYGEDSDEDEDTEMMLEIFPDGDELAIAISEDLWPNALKYFTQAQEQDALSDADFESDEGGFDALAEQEISDVEADEDEDDKRPAKKRRS